MKFKGWNEIAELIGIVAIVASLIFVGLQMKQSQEIARADRFEQRIANGIESRNTINEYANIWAKGNFCGIMRAKSVSEQIRGK